MFDDFVRVYFSTRERDATGKYLSHVSFADFDFTFTKILQVASHEVIKLGDLGCFDEHGIFPFSPFKENGRVVAYTTGWNRRVSTAADAGIGLAISNDNGFTFNKYGKGPVMTWSVNEPFLVGDAFVKRYNSQYYMWYIFGVRWIKNELEQAPQRVYKIAQATSSDGINWVRNGQFVIEDRLNPDECQALPTVARIGDGYHMFFCFREAFGFRNNREKAYRIGYAYSKDLVRWHRSDREAGIDVSDNGWDSDMMCYPSVFECKGDIYMLYNGNEFGKFGFGLAILEK